MINQSIRSLKSLATRIKRERQISKTEALTEIAKNIGFASWDELLFSHPESTERKEAEKYARDLLRNYLFAPNTDISWCARSEFTFYEFIDHRFENYLTDELFDAVNSDEIREHGIEISEWHLIRFERHMHNKIRLLYKKGLQHTTNFINHTLFDFRNGYSAYFYLNYTSGKDAPGNIDLRELDQTRFDFGVNPLGMAGYRKFKGTQQHVDATEYAIKCFMKSCELSQVVASIEITKRFGLWDLSQKFLHPLGWKFNGKSWIYYFDRET